MNKGAARPGPVVRFLQLRWLGPDRARGYAIILAFASLASMYWLFERAMHGPDGSDFLAFWSAARLAVAHRAAEAYHPAALALIQIQTGAGQVFAFVNPPPLLLAIWPLGLLDYPAAWIAWVAATYLVWLGATRRLYPRFAWPIAAFPGALVAAWHAQTGFLTSALQAGAAALLARRPFAAGLCVGALVVKPHLALLFPVALVAGRHWRAIAGAAVSAIALAMLAALVFGVDVLRAYPQSWAVSQRLLDTGGAVFFLRQVTVYAMVRALVSAPAALAAQAAATLAVAVLTWRAWSRSGPPAGKLALLFAATPLATPYLFAYDLPFLAIPVCWLAERWSAAGWPGWSKPLLVALYVSPLAARAMALPAGIDAMPLVSMAIVWLVWRQLASAEEKQTDKTAMPPPVTAA